MSAVKVSAGDRVRVVLEGEVAKRPLNGQFVVGQSGQANHIIPTAAHVVSIEVLPPPEPEVERFGPGDVVEHKTHGTQYIVGKGGVFSLTYHKFHSEPEDWLEEYMNTKYYKRIELAEVPF